jgi:hypothetical protein
MPNVRRKGVVLGQGRPVAAKFICITRTKDEISKRSFNQVRLVDAKRELKQVRMWLIGKNNKHNQCRHRADRITATVTSLGFHSLVSQTTHTE